MKKCITAEIVFASDLTYSEARAVVTNAELLFGDRFCNYAVVGSPTGKKNDWKAVAYIRDILQDFLNNPEKYVIEI